MPDPMIDEIALRARLDDLATATMQSSVVTEPVAAVARRVGVRRRRRRRRALCVSAAAVVAIVSLGSWRVVADEQEPTRRLDVINPTTVPVPATSVPETSATTSLPATASTTSVQPTPGGPSGVTGIAELDPGPLAPRHGALVLDTGTRVLVWGGGLDASNAGATTMSNARYNDGAVYDVVSGAWRPMAPSPLPLVAGPPIGVWTGKEALVFQGTRAAAYDPVTDTWRNLAVPAATPQRVVWTGSTVVALGPDALYDPARDAWTPITGPPAFKDLDRRLTPQLVWTGRSAVVATVAYGGPKVVTVFSIDPVTGAATRLPDGLLTNRDDIIVATSDGDGRVTFVGRGMGVARFDTRTNTWLALPSVPLKSYEGSPGWVTLRGERIFVNDGGGSFASWDGARWTVVRTPFAGVNPGSEEYLFAVDFALRANRFLRIDRATYASARRELVVSYSVLDLPAWVEVEHVELERDDDGDGIAVEAALTVASPPGDVTCTMRSELFGFSDASSPARETARGVVEVKVARGSAVRVTCPTSATALDLAGRMTSLSAG